MSSDRNELLRLAMYNSFWDWGATSRTATMMVIRGDDQHVVRFVLPQDLSIPSILRQADVVVPPNYFMEFRFDPDSRIHFLVQLYPVAARQVPATQQREHQVQQPAASTNDENQVPGAEHMDTSESRIVDVLQIVDMLSDDDSEPSTSTGIKRKRSPREMDHFAKRSR